jgi:hypothetical protein
VLCNWGALRIAWLPGLSTHTLPGCRPSATEQMADLRSSGSQSPESRLPQIIQRLASIDPDWQGRTRALQGITVRHCAAPLHRKGLNGLMKPSVAVDVVNCLERRQSLRDLAQMRARLCCGGWSQPWRSNFQTFARLW